MAKRNHTNMKTRPRKKKRKGSKFVTFLIVMIMVAGVAVATSPFWIAYLGQYLGTGQILREFDRIVTGAPQDKGGIGGWIDGLYTQLVVFINRDAATPVDAEGPTIGDTAGDEAMGGDSAEGQIASGETKGSANSSGRKTGAADPTPAPTAYLRDDQWFTWDDMPIIFINELPGPLADYDTEYDMLSDIISEGEGEYDPAPEVNVPSGMIKLVMVGRMRIDRLAMNLPIVEGCTATPLKYAIGHLPSSAMPGEEGNFYTAGHRAYTPGVQFNRMGEIEFGDMVIVEDMLGNTFHYIVDEIFLIAPGDRSPIDDWEPGEYRMSMQTCHPIFVGTYRLVVRATMIDYLMDEEGHALLDEEGNVLARPTPRPTPTYALDIEIEKGTPTRPPWR